MPTVTESVGPRVLVSDNLDTYKTVADEQGLFPNKKSIIPKEKHQVKVRAHISANAHFSDQSTLYPAST